MTQIVAFHGTAEPVTVIADAAGLAELRGDPMVHVMAARADLVNAGRFTVLYRFNDPIEAARELELPLRMSIEQS